MTHAGEQFGPVSIDDLKFEVERGELNPRLDMVWKEGMEDWIPAGKVEGLFEKNVEAEEKEKAKEAPPVVAPVSEVGKKQAKKEQVGPEREGTNRMGFIFFCYIFPVIWFVGVVLGAEFLKGQVGPDIFGPITIVLFLLPLVVGIAATLKRFQNLAMTRLWFFGLIVPFLNYWLGYRLFACPAGYAEHKKLGGAGWFLAIIYWLPFLAIAGFGVFAGLKGPEATQTMMEDGLKKMGVDIEELQKKASEEESSEEAKPSRY